MFISEGSEVEAQQVRESESALLRLNLLLVKLVVTAHPHLADEVGELLRSTRCRILDYELGAAWDREVRMLAADMPTIAPIVALPV
jgi:hypothetical protein